MIITYKVEVTDEFLKSLLENLPEACISFHCSSWDYENCIFELEDIEDEQKYTLTLEKAREGFKIIANEIMQGKLPGLNIAPSDIIDEGAWDAYAIDAFVQCAVLGEVVYG